MSDDSSTGLEGGDFVYLSLDFHGTTPTLDAQSELAPDTSTDISDGHPFRDTFAILLGRGASPELEEELYGASVGDTGLVEITWTGDIDAEGTAEDPPHIRAPARSVDDMLPEWLATISRQEGAVTPHEFVDLSISDIADEYMLDPERLADFQSQLADSIDGWLLAKYEVADGCRWADTERAVTGETANQSTSNTTAPVDQETTYENDGSVSASPGNHTGVLSSETDNEDYTTGVGSNDTPPMSGWPTFGAGFARTGTTTDSHKPSDTVSVAWTHSTPGSVEAAPAVSDGFVYTGSKSGTLRALNEKTGETRWTSDRGLEIASAPAVADGLVFVGGLDGNLYAVETTRGKVEWSVEATRRVYGSPTVSDGVVYVGGQGGTFYAIDTDSGEKIWSANCGKIRSAPTVVGETVYVGSKKDAVYALDRQSGETIWTYQTARPVWSSPAVVNGMVYVGCWDDHLYALNEDTGDLAWKFDTGHSIQGSPAIESDTVFVGNNGNDVYALDPATGDIRWQQSLRGSVRNTVAVVDDTVFAGCADGTLAALAAETGDTRWTVDVESRIYTSPAVSDGAIYVGISDGLCALTTEESAIDS